MRYQELLEARIEIGDNLLSVCKNPTAQMLAFFIGNTRSGIARGTLIGIDLHCWDAYLATHAQVQAYYGVDQENNFDFAERSEGSFAFSCPEAELHNAVANPNLQRVLSGPMFVIARENGEEQTLGTLLSGMD